MLTHQSILTNIKGLEKSLNLKKFKNFMAITPLFHNNGQFIPTLLSIKTYGTSLPVNSKTSIVIFWDLVKDFKINYSSVMATHINYLTKNSKSYKNHNLLGFYFVVVQSLMRIFRKNLKRNFLLKLLVIMV